MLLVVCLVSAPFASAQYTDSITVLGGLGAVSRDALEEMLDLVACKCAGGGGGPVTPCATCECACEKCVFLKAHPAGSIYMTTDDVNPADTYGGIWARWGQGRVPVGVGAATDYNTAGDTSFKPLPYLTAGEMGGSLGSTGNASVDLTGVSVSGSIPISGGVTVNSDGSVNPSNTPTLSIGGTALTAAQMPRHSHAVYSEFGASGNISFPPNVVGGSYAQLSGTAGAYAPRDGYILHTGGSGTAQAASDGDSHSHTPTVQWPTFSLTSPTASHNITASSENLVVSGNGTATITDSTLQPYVTCYMWKRDINDTDNSCPTPDCPSCVCACGGGGGMGGGCDCEPYTATLPISITDNDISIDLSDYVTSSDLTTALGGYVTSTSLTTTLGGYVTSTSLTTTLSGYVTSTGLATTLGSYYTKAEINAMQYSFPTTQTATGETYNGKAVYVRRFTSIARGNNLLQAGVTGIVDCGGYVAANGTLGACRYALNSYYDATDNNCLLINSSNELRLYLWYSTVSGCDFWVKYTIT